MIFHQFSQPALSVENAFGRTEDVVAVREEAGEIGRGVRRDVEDVPDVGDSGNASPLEGEAEGGGVGGDGNVDCACFLALCNTRVSVRTLAAEFRNGKGVLSTFALQRPSVTVLPAQLRTSWPNSWGSESSYRDQ